MSKRTEEDYLRDILEASRRIFSYTESMNYEDFLRDIKTQDAVMRNIEIIGEATKNISAEIRIEHREIPWKSLAGMRDKLIHDYFGVNIDIVWGVLAGDLPKLVDQIGQILSNSDENKKQNG